jgi:hypothetical protein
MRFHRSFKIFPGLRLNLSKSGLGLSAGVRGLRVGLDAKGRSYVNAGLPGTGLSVREYAKKGSSPHVAPPASQPPLPRRALDAGVESRGVGKKVALGLLGAGTLVIGVLFTTSHLAENPPVVAVVTPEEKAIETAKRELASAHPEFKSTNIAQDAPYPARTVAGGFEVRLRYLSAVGGFLPFVCQVQGLTATCVPPPAPPRARKTGQPGPSPTRAPSRGLAGSAPATGQLYVGPRGGVYHYSPSGKKVYERRRR